MRLATKYRLKSGPESTLLGRRGMHKTVIAQRNLCFDAAIHVCLGHLNALQVDRRRLCLRDDAVFSYLILLKNLLNLRTVENALRA